MQYQCGLTDNLSRKSRISLLYYPLFCLRRVGFCAISFLMASTPAQQVQLILLLHLFQSIYQGNNRPLETRLRNNTESLNELTTFLATLHLFFFTDWVDDLELQFLYGWSMVIIICISIMWNMAIVFFFTAKQIKLVVIKYYRRIKHQFYKILVKIEKNETPSSSESEDDQVSHLSEVNEEPPKEEKKS